MTPPRDIAKILFNQLAGRATTEEQQQLQEWIAQSQDNKELIETLSDDETLAERVKWFHADEREARTQRMWERISSNIQTQQVPKVRRMKWWRYAAAAAILVIATITFYITNQKEKPSVTQNNPVPVQNEIAPGGNKAVLTLADGRQIVLDQTQAGELAKEGYATITKTKEGAVVYSGRHPERSEGSVVAASYNTMVTPRGGQYQLILPDGTQVWLNAESSITYPTSFNEKKRRVTITGEAYFEVAKNKAKPFMVTVIKNDMRSKNSPLQENNFPSLREGSGVGSNTMQIEVLGTHFNVNAYNEEPTINTTLIEGKVKISARDAKKSDAQNTVLTSLLLKPGQQGQLRNEELVLAKDPDVNQVMAWKNGVFNFNGQDFATSMRQLERWYDIKVVYDGKVPAGTFLGTFDKTLNLFDAIELLNGVVAKFKLEGRQLHVLQQAQ